MQVACQIFLCSSLLFIAVGRVVKTRASGGSTADSAGIIERHIAVKHNEETPSEPDAIPPYGCGNGGAACATPGTPSDESDKPGTLAQTSDENAGKADTGDGGPRVDDARRREWAHKLNVRRQRANQLDNPKPAQSIAAPDAGAAIEESLSRATLDEAVQRSDLAGRPDTYDDQAGYFGGTNVKEMLKNMVQSAMRQMLQSLPGLIDEKCGSAAGFKKTACDTYALMRCKANVKAVCSEDGPKFVFLPGRCSLCWSVSSGIAAKMCKKSGSEVSQAFKGELKQGQCVEILQHLACAKIKLCKCNQHWLSRCRSLMPTAPPQPVPCQTPCPPAGPPPKDQNADNFLPSDETSADVREAGDEGAATKEADSGGSLAEAVLRSDLAVRPDTYDNRANVLDQAGYAGGINIKGMLENVVKSAMSQWLQWLPGLIDEKCGSAAGFTKTACDTYALIRCKANVKAVCSADGPRFMFFPDRCSMCWSVSSGIAAKMCKKSDSKVSQAFKGVLKQGQCVEILQHLACAKIKLCKCNQHWLSRCRSLMPTAPPQPPTETKVPCLTPCPPAGPPTNHENADDFLPSDETSAGVDETGDSVAATEEAVSGAALAEAVLRSDLAGSPDAFDDQANALDRAGYFGGGIVKNLVKSAMGQMLQSLPGLIDEKCGSAAGFKKTACDAYALTRCGGNVKAVCSEDGPKKVVFFQGRCSMCWSLTSGIAAQTCKKSESKVSQAFKGELKQGQCVEILQHLVCAKLNLCKCNQPWLDRCQNFIPTAPPCGSTTTPGTGPCPASAS